ncbi:MAG: circularly permuted type 2 ATP-grasp protein, partial [Alphaproteobacteria bacterium]
VMDRADWARIEAGVVQRARLADAVLADVYGRQRLIASGTLPPHVVVGHPQFLRAVCGVVPPGGVHVHIHAVDLARAPGGDWTVLADRVESPGGMGYALENRLVVSQAFAEPFRDGGVRRLAHFFHAMRESVFGLAQSDRPRGVMLTPGPYNEAYFEHAFLAHYLGLSLVEGEDLAVHDGDVWLKTLAGLERVDVVFRRVDSVFCDPLELRPDSTLGIPGLVEAARAGRVVLANPLGGAVMESPAMAAFLPATCRALLGEELLLAGVPTEWCGTAARRRRVLDALPRPALRDAFDGRPPTLGAAARPGGTDGEARRALAEMLERRGASFVAQQPATLGLAPALEEGRLVPRPMALRVFAAWTPGGWTVLPGGLARIARDEAAAPALSMQSGAAAKDVWVPSDARDDHFTMLRPPDRPLAIRRGGDEAPSRAMDNLLWLGRYAERAEGLVRTVRAVVRRLGDDAEIEPAAAVDLARRLLVPQAQASEAAVAAAASGDAAPLARELLALVGDRRHPYGLVRLLGSVQRTAWAVRDRLSLDTWRAIQVLAGATGETPGEVGGLAAHLDMIVRRSAALAGLAAENMTRGRNWRFLDLGRRIERGMDTSWLVARLLAEDGDARDTARLQLALEIADSAMTYRYRYLGVFQAAPVLDLLLLDEGNPRSTAFQLATLAGHVADLPRAAFERIDLTGAIMSPMVARLQAADPRVVATADAAGGRPALAALVDETIADLARLSDAIADACFRPTVRRRTGSAPRREGA